eukprot:825377-Pleurochrysis_carterae.AAC.1
MLAHVQGELKAGEKSLLNVEAMKKAADDDEERWRVCGENLYAARKNRGREEKEQVARKRVQSGNDDEVNDASVRMAAKVPECTFGEVKWELRTHSNFLAII